MWFGILILAMVSFATPVDADPIVSNWLLTDPVATDSWIAQKLPTLNFGASDSLMVGTAGKNRRGLFAFPTPVLLPGMSLLEAELTVHLRRFAGDPTDSVRIGVHRLFADWDEGSGASDGVTWNERRPGDSWSTAGGDYDTSAAATAIAYPADSSLTFDVTSLIQYWMDNSSENHGLLLRSFLEAGAISEGVGDGLAGGNGNSASAKNLDDQEDNAAGRINLIIHSGEAADTAFAPHLRLLVSPGDDHLPPVSGVVAELSPPVIVGGATASCTLHVATQFLGAGYDTGVDEVTLPMPSGFATTGANGVQFNGIPISWSNSGSASNLTVTLSDEVNTDGVIRVVFDMTAPAPTTPANFAFSPTVDDTKTAYASRPATEGDADGDPWDGNSLSIDVTGQPVSITVLPGSATITADDSIQFTATGVDGAGHEVPVVPHWSVVPDGYFGTIDSSGLFDGQTAMLGLVLATHGSLVDSVWVTVTPGAPVVFAIGPSSAEISTVDTVRFNAIAIDSDFNWFPVQPAWSVVSGSGTVDSNGVYRPESVGVANIVGAYGGFTDTSVVTTHVGPLHVLQVSPQTTTLNTEESVTFAATGHDSLGFALPDDSLSLVWSGGSSIGVVDPSSGDFEPTTVGTDSVLVTSGGVTGASGIITVIAGPTRSVSITPPTATIQVGETAVFSATTVDGEGNTTSDAVDWGVLGNVGGITGDGTFTAAATGSGFVTATVGSVSDSATVAVLDSGGISVEFLSEDRDGVTRGEQDLHVFAAIRNNTGDNVTGASATLRFETADRNVTSEYNAILVTSLPDPLPDGMIDTVHFLVDVDAGATVDEEVELFLDFTGSLAGSGTLLGTSGPDVPGSWIATAPPVVFDVAHSLYPTSAVAGTGPGFWMGLENRGAVSVTLSSGSSLRFVKGSSSFHIPIDIDIELEPGEIPTPVYFNTSAIPPGTEPGSYAVDLVLAGTDQNGATYGVEKAASSSLVVEPPGIFVRATTLPGGIVAPGTPETPLLAFDMTNYDIQTRTLTSLIVSNPLLSPGTVSDRDGMFDVIYLVNDNDGDGTWDTGESELDNGQFEGGEFTFSGFSLALETGDSISLLVVGDLGSRGPPDGIHPTASLANSAALGFGSGATVDGSFPLTSPGSPTVDGMVAAGCSLSTILPADLPASSVDSLVMSVQIPSNGFLPDTLLSLAVRNLGNPGTVGDIESIRLWEDGGDGFLDRGTSDDTDLGTLFWIGDDWIRSGLGRHLPAGGRRYFITATINESPAGSVIQLAIPVNGIQVESANDGPRDTDVHTSLIQTIGGSKGVFVSTVNTGMPLPAPPGAEAVSLLQFQLTNRDSVATTLDAIVVDNRSIARSTAADSLIDVLSIRHAGSQATIAVTGFNSGEALFTGLDVTIASADSITLELIATVGVNCATDGDSLAVALLAPSSLQFDGSPLIAGSFPVVAPTATPVDGFSLAQTISGPIEGGPVFPSATDVLAMEVHIPGNGCVADTLRAMHVDNARGTAEPDDVARVFMTNALTGVTHDLFWNGNGWSREGLDVLVPADGIPIELRFALTDSATDGRTVELEIPVSGIEMASRNDGPVDDPIVSQATFVISSAPLFATLSGSHNPVTTGQSFHVTLEVEHVGSEPIHDIFVDTLRTSGPAVSVLEAPSIVDSLLPGNSALFEWTLRAEEEGSLVLASTAGGVTASTGDTVAAPTATSDPVRVQSPPGDLNLAATSTLAETVTRGAVDEPAFFLNLSHIDGPEDEATVSLSSIRIRFDDGDGNVLAPGELLDGLILRDETGDVAGVVTPDSLISEMVAIHLDLPRLLPPGAGQVFHLSLVIAEETTADQFRAVIDPTDAISAMDINSGVSLSLRNEDAIYSTTSSVVTPASGLTVNIRETVPPQINRGATGVSIMRLEVESESEGGTTEDVSISGLSFAVSHGPFPFESITVRRGTATHFAGPGWVEDSTRLFIPLNPAVVITSGEAVPLTITGDVTSEPLLGTFSIGVVDSLLLSPSPSSPAIPQVTVSLPEPWETRVVVRTEAILVEPVDRADTPAATPGDTGLEAFSLVFRHTGGDSLSDVSIESIRFRLESASGDSSAIIEFADRVYLFHGGKSLVAVAPLVAGAATLEIPIPRNSPIDMAAGDVESLTVSLDISGDASPGDYRFAVESGHANVTESNEGGPTDIILLGGDPYRSPVFEVRRQSDRVLVAGSIDLPATTIPGAHITDAGILRFVASGSEGDSELHLRTVRVVTEGDHGSIDAARLLSGANAVSANGDTSEAVFDDGQLRFRFEPAIVLMPAESLSVTLSLVVADSPGHNRFRIAVYAEDISLDESGPSVEFAGGAESVHSGYTHFADKDFAKSVRNYPNPFSSYDGETTIAFYARGGCRATIQIFTGMGIPVQTLDAIIPSEGLIELGWDGFNGEGKRVISGVYLASIELQYDEGGQDHAIRKIAVVH